VSRQKAATATDAGGDEQQGDVSAVCACEGDRADGDAQAAGDADSAQGSQVRSRD
jgi:hypothetical protein